MLDASHRLEHIFNISMTPILAFDRRDGGDISSAKSMCPACEQYQSEEEDE
jgi:hypothetical protein